MAVGFQWSLYSAVVLLSVHAAYSPQCLQGLFCVNDFVKSVTCSWRHKAFDPSSDCWLSGVETTHVIKNNRRETKPVSRSCKLQQHGEFQRCTFSFITTTFNSYGKIPAISVSCNTTVIETCPDYSPKNHIKMHPPGTPNVSSSINVTRISWGLGSPHSVFLRSFNFEVQIKRILQSWNVSA